MPADRVVSVSGINRAGISGSFLISVYAEIDGTRRHLGTAAVLSRWHVEGCMNCQTHLEAKATFPLAHDGAQFLTPADRRGAGRRRGRGAHAHGPLWRHAAPRRRQRRRRRTPLLATEKDAPFKVEIR